MTLTDALNLANTAHVLIVALGGCVLLSMLPGRQWKMIAVGTVVMVIVLSLVTLAQARADRWTAADSASQAVVLTALAADYLQTRQIVACAQSGERCSDPSANHTEANPVMGERGQRVPVAGVLRRRRPRPRRRRPRAAAALAPDLAGRSPGDLGHNMSYGYSIRF